MSCAIAARSSISSCTVAASTVELSANAARSRICFDRSMICSAPLRATATDEPMTARFSCEAPSAPTSPRMVEEIEKYAALSLELWTRSEEHTSELQSLMRISYAVFCLKKKILTPKDKHKQPTHRTKEQHKLNMK